MKRLILMALILLFPMTSYGIFGIGDNKDKKDTVSDAKPIPKKCHFQVNLSGTIYFIFESPCGEIRQVGIMDEASKEMLTLDKKLSLTGHYKYFTEEKKDEIIDKNWKNMQFIPVYKLE